MAGAEKLSFWSKLWHSPLVRLCVWVIGAIAAFLQYLQAGVTWLFWALCIVTLGAMFVYVVLVVIKWLQKWNLNRIAKTPYYNYQQGVDLLTALIKDFETIEKSKNLASASCDNARVVSILPVDGRLGVMLNIGEKEGLQEGTRLLVHRMDHYTSDGHFIEEPLGIVEVTYVQAGNNCSQAVVSDPIDQEFWDQAALRLKKEKRIDPPKNFAGPYVPKELSSVPLEHIKTLREYLELSRTAFINIRQQ